MLKTTVAALALALAATASAAGWRDLRVDASSEAAFQQSLAVFNEELSAERQHVFSAALMDIWIQGTTEAKANQREYTASDYYQQLHGLSYEEVVTFTDPTGETAKARKREADRAQVVGASQPVSPPGPAESEGAHGSRAPSNRFGLAHEDAEFRRSHAARRNRLDGSGYGSGSGSAVAPSVFGDTRSPGTDLFIRPFCGPS